MDIIYNFNKIQQVWQYHINLKKDLQTFLASGNSNFWFYHYSQCFKLKQRKRKDMYLTNYIQENYNNICFLNP